MSICEHIHPSWNNGTAEVKIVWMSGILWHIIWLNCPDKENLIAGWFSKKEHVIKFSEDNNLIVKEIKKHKPD